MLEIKNLTKIYKPKKGVAVKALDNVSLKLPQSGMVFLLGRSGSGKSTLLNLLGGLDRYDEGEIIIKGVSSKSFKQQHFDSYRNTYVGFIFQEYNVLEDFSVGANIGLALELQGRKAAEPQINSILAQVELAGYGNRKPNELSGGQKQRVAIARALVKNPEIIMADEPTGALDSATGRQVLETLKKLSADHLVIVVSHDREFAEQYADRIIELADGRIIGDVERSGEALPQEEALSFTEEGLEVAAGYRLTEEDRLAINAYLEGMEQGTLTVRQKKKSAARFTATDQEKIEMQKGAHFRLIKSRLPLASAFRMGASSLKYKKIRLCVTILLSCIAFGLFGLSDTFGAYNHIETCTESIIDSDITYASVSRAVLIGEGDDAYWDSYGYKLDDTMLEKIKKNTGVAMTGVYTPRNGSMEFTAQMDISKLAGESENDLYIDYFSGFGELTEGKMKQMGYQLSAGALPDGEKDEIAISAYLAESFLKGGYRENESEKWTEIKSYQELLGKTLWIAGDDYTIVGVVDTQFPAERYELLNESEENLEPAEQLVRYALRQEWNYSTDYSFVGLAMVGDGGVERLIAKEPPFKRMTSGSLYFYNDRISLDFSQVGRLSDFKDEVLWLDTPRKTLGEREIIISSGYLLDYFAADKSALTAEECRELGKEIGGLTGYYYTGTEDITEQDWKVVGILPDLAGERTWNVLLPDSRFEALTQGDIGNYDFAVGVMPEEKSAIRTLVSYCVNGEEGERYPLQNSVTYELNLVNDVLKTLSKVFLYIGLGFALFAALMLANFISTSISYKKQEIGILRAIGSRSHDVFRIFFCESFVIAMINFVLSAIGVFAATALINYILRTEAGILITVLNFSLRQVGLLLAVSLLVAAAASYIPVRRIAAKRPIDAIRNR